MKQEKFSESLQILQELLTALNQSVDSFSLRASIVNLIAECYFRQDKFIMLLESIKLLETPEFSALDKQLQIELLSKKAQADENLWLFQQAKSALVKISELDATLVAEDLKRLDALI